jgi:hypothetical protein
VKINAGVTTTAIFFRAFKTTARVAYGGGNAACFIVLEPLA